MGIWHVQDFWMVYCWPVLLRLGYALCSYWNSPQNTCPAGEKLLVLQSWCSCLQYLVLLKALWYSLHCCLSIWVVIGIICSLISTKEQDWKDKGHMQFLLGEGVRWSCTTRMELFFVGSEELCFLWRDDTQGPGEASGSGHALPAPFSLLTVAVYWPCRSLWNAEQSIFWEPPALPLRGKQWWQQGWHTQQWWWSCSGKKPQKIFNKPGIAGLECCRHIQAWKV